MSGAKFLTWLKYVVGVTALFVMVGFTLQVLVEGNTPAQAWDLLLEKGLYQSTIFAIVVATFISMK
ncbi:MAG: hypothetical protein OEY50_07900 [Nitrospinota bacterium]|nr:hypothetical protein [Nitrospinota bacterium]MDH5679365.1 hypothetical protein [Nitrospinota bacterium]MDH5757349.1 hypothetical protein [Nitrospinota bacterium]